MTSEGLCFKFNALNSDDIYTDEVVSEMIKMRKSPNVLGWSLETGYTQKSDQKNIKYPNTADAGQKNGLELLLSLFENDYDFMCSQFQGILITLSVPGETRIEFQNSASIELSENYRLIIEPKFSDISKGLRRYKPEQRECFFNSERQLRFYKFYTKDNCVDECFANVTKKLCGCVLFSMPRDNQTKICGAAKIKCYKYAVRKLYSLFGQMHLKECNCIDSCTYIEYNLKVEQSHLYMEETTRSQTNNTSQRQVHLSIFFKDSSVGVVERMETYTITDFLAICGGLLGIFLGISLLSLVEIIYFATLRLFWIIRRPRTENIETPPDIPLPENLDD
ncbi:pickpocket protein 28-like [Contarinia nasturtii]|uniref:pickpocket protein 28-like n=1 Tax=Contarinia nasturtii TaxID=265458 RepID=UPI0012D46DAC|nr:pickpocket protein 28-like [Contarinia nasturtii]